MRVLFDILHPAHVHVFRHAIGELRARGDEVLVTAREKDVAVPLLARMEIPHKVLTHRRTGVAGLAAEYAARLAALAREARAFRADLMTGIMGVCIAPVGRLLGIPAVVFYDTENALRTNLFAYRLARRVVVPDCYRGWTPRHTTRYPGYHELAYLHPARFRPDPARARAAGADPGRPYSVVRFVRWAASHDIGDRGLAAGEKEALVAHLARRGPVFVSSEEPLPPSLASLSLRAPPEEFHHLLAFADRCVGESATVASEAAVLGVPSIYVARTGRGYTSEQEERYGLVRWCRAVPPALETLRRWDAEPDLRAIWSDRRARMLRERIDVTAWMMQNVFART